MGWSIFATGFFTTAGLIVAIGAQNSFVLRQGIKRECIFLVCLTCFLCDVILMSVGVLGIGKAINNNPLALLLLTLVGAVFLLCYGANALKSAWRGQSHMAIVQGAGEKRQWLAVLAATLAVTWLNPHVWLDTVAIIGGVSAGIPSPMKMNFLVGALSASFIWFFLLGYFSVLLARYFTRAITWRVLDSFIGGYMLYLAIKLFHYTLPLIKQLV